MRKFCAFFLVFHLFSAGSLCAMYREELYCPSSMAVHWSDINSPDAEPSDIGSVGTPYLSPLAFSEGFKTVTIGDGFFDEEPDGVIVERKPSTCVVVGDISGLNTDFEKKALLEHFWASDSDDNLNTPLVSKIPAMSLLRRCVQAVISESELAEARGRLSKFSKFLLAVHLADTQDYEESRCCFDHRHEKTLQIVAGLRSDGAAHAF